MTPALARALGLDLYNAGLIINLIMGAIGLIGAAVILFAVGRRLGIVPACAVSVVWALFIVFLRTLM